MIFRPTRVLQLFVVAGNCFAFVNALWFEEFFDNVFASCPKVDKCGLFQYRMESCLQADVVCAFKVATYEDDGYTCQSQASCEKAWLSFQEGALDENTTDQKMIDQEGNLDGKFKEHHDLLSANDCHVLINLADQTYEETIKKGIKVSQANAETNLTDFRFSLTPEKLRDVLPRRSLENLLDVIRNHADGYYMSSISMRRTLDNGSKAVDFHNDGDHVVAFIINLNKDELGNGGDLHYVTRKGVNKTSVGSGGGVIHSDSIIHGVSGFHGTRYILFLLASKKAEKEMFKDFVIEEPCATHTPLMVGASEL